MGEHVQAVLGAISALHDASSLCWAHGFTMCTASSTLANESLFAFHTSLNRSDVAFWQSSPHRLSPYVIARETRRLALLGTHCSCASSPLMFLQYKCQFLSVSQSASLSDASATSANCSGIYLHIPFAFWSSVRLPEDDCNV